MTPPAATATARRATAPAPAAAPPRRRRLRVVEAPRPQVSVLTMVLAGALLLTVVFGVVAFHTLLVSNQSDLDDLDRRIEAEVARSEQLRLRAAELAAPERIVRVASDELGMVTPEEVVWLEPVAVEETAGD